MLFYAISVTFALGVVCGILFMVACISHHEKKQAIADAELKTAVDKNVDLVFYNVPGLVEK